MKYAVTDYDGCEYITAGKRYEVISEDDGYFEVINDNGSKIGFCLEMSNHLNGNDWRIEMNNDIEQQGNDFEVKYNKDTPEEMLESISDRLNEIDGILNWDDEIKTIRAALVSQKQPEMSKSDVTRSDIELRDYFAGQALQGMLAAGANWEGMVNETHNPYAPNGREEPLVNKTWRIATAMMEARK